jgi:hypothetical protein
MSRAVGMQRRRGRQDDEVHDEIRGEHAREDVNAQATQFRIRRAFALREVAPHRAFFLNFVRSQPEKQVRLDRSAENAHEHRQGVM